MTSGTATKRKNSQREVVAAARRAEERRNRRSWITGLVVVVVFTAVVAVMMLTSRATSTTETKQAPDFTLTDTSGNQVSLDDFRGESIVLYFNEGAGCGSCIQQMASIEAEQEKFDAAGITVLPIVMNTREQILADMAAYGATTPFLLDDGTVSEAYGTLGKGMHEGLPGHSFVLIDADGVQRWYGEYPSMWLEPQELLDEVQKRLPER